MPNANTGGSRHASQDPCAVRPASSPNETLEAIYTARTLLRQADAHARLREYQDPDTLEFDRSTHELVKCLALARVSIGEAITSAQAGQAREHDG
jgi:hypothetical protein